MMLVILQAYISASHIWARLNMVWADKRDPFGVDSCLDDHKHSVWPEATSSVFHCYGEHLAFPQDWLCVAVGQGIKGVWLECLRAENG